MLRRAIRGVAFAVPAPPPDTCNSITTYPAVYSYILYLAQKNTPRRGNSRRVVARVWRNYYELRHWLKYYSSSDRLPIALKYHLCARGDVSG